MDQGDLALKVSRTDSPSSGNVTDDPGEFLSFFKVQTPIFGPATMNRAMLVSPQGFRVSPQSAEDNVYMDPSKLIDCRKALEQHDSVRQKLDDLAIETVVFPGIDGFDDAVYPNNAFATRSGHLIVGRMFHPVRQQETSRLDIRSYFHDQGYQTIDLSNERFVAELTGSLIIDHRRRIGFCGLSSRTDIRGAKSMHKAFDLGMTYFFDLVSEEYHTNIVLSILAGRSCVIYPNGWLNSEQAQAVIRAYGSSAIILSEDEKNHFAGNCLAVTPNDVMLSQRAYNALRPATISHFASLNFQLHPVDISELEKGGGSLRCLIAEIY